MNHFIYRMTAEPSWSLNITDFHFLNAFFPPVHLIHILKFIIKNILPNFRLKSFKVKVRHPFLIKQVT